MPIIDLIMPLGFIGLLPIIRKVIVNANYLLITFLCNDAKIFSYLNIVKSVTPTLLWIFGITPLLHYPHQYKGHANIILLNN